MRVLLEGKRRPHDAAERPLRVAAVPAVAVGPATTIVGATPGNAPLPAECPEDRRCRG